MSKTYSEKLKDPRWQKKRLEILERDGWKCRICQNTESTLHVHHLQYAKSGNPWDVNNNRLMTLCWECHENEETFSEAIKESISDIIINGGCGQWVWSALHKIRKEMGIVRENPFDYE